MKIRFLNVDWAINAYYTTLMREIQRIFAGCAAGCAQVDNSVFMPKISRILNKITVLSHFGAR